MARTSGARSKAPLSKDRVVRAAIALADKEGLEALTMRKLAQGLGVEAMSLYHHVSNKEAILNEMVDWIFGEFRLPTTEEPWKETLRARAISAHDVLVSHPWAIHVIETRRDPGPLTLQHHEAVLACLRHGGFSVPLTAHAYALLDSHIYGFVMQEMTLPFRTYEEVEELAEHILAQMPEELFPSFTELTREYILKPGYAYANEFAFGLDLILDGLERAKESEQMT
ncbi:MAG: TetR/AcrR family transcriptional regulator C-terminal domain-containing protein [Hyphomicrobiaceae bacterium]|nr:TetR/AcrR family transcriptional regulator C-terminal domain-containing protein [Hyphomicrobiaceae bacterium]MCC0023122.1 TetR/AcrR family transcriptional regulator C-terminal domain-containing protein [Hyphomicrobiaceae bacterium]